MEKLSAIKMGWILVMFDLPVLTKKQRKSASDFRDSLLDDGFLMVQFSVYARPCQDTDRLEKHKVRLRENVPKAGNVRTLYLTDLQWSRGECIIGPNFDQGSRQMELTLADQSEFWE